MVRIRPRIKDDYQSYREVDMEDIMEVSESKIRMTTARSISKEKITRKKYLDSI